MIFLIRGLPGSGKSTYAQKLLNIHPDAVHVEADMFFIRDEEYEFEPSKLKEAHDWCFVSFNKALLQSQKVIVSNTFTTYDELKRYFDTAYLMKVPIVVVEMLTQYESAHGVPEQTMQRMKSRWVPVEKIVEKTLEDYHNLNLSFVRIE
jgi:adenylate kinase family enzyme